MKYTNSVDTKETDKFSKIASEWWDQNGKFKVLHRFNDARVQFIDKIINQFYENKPVNILDIGCGGGLLSESFAKKNHQVTGIDYDHETIKQAKIHAKKQNLEIVYLKSSPEDFAQQSKDTFDVIFAMEIIEHVQNPQGFINTLSNLLNKNGLIFFSTINRNLKSIVLAKVMAEYILNWLPKGTHDIKKFVTPEEIKSMLLNNNIRMKEIMGINYSLLENNWKLHSIPSINYICYGIKQ